MNLFLENNGSIVTINRGDTFEAPLFINMGTLLKPVRYYVQGDDKVYLGIREPNSYFEYSLVKKVYDKDSRMTEDGDIIIRLEAKDTEYLLPGTYYYCVKLVQTQYEDEDGNPLEYPKEDVTTVIKDTLFYIV